MGCYYFVYCSGIQVFLIAAIVMPEWFIEGWSRQCLFQNNLLKWSSFFNFFQLLLDQKLRKIKTLYNFCVFLTRFFHHAIQAVHHENVLIQRALGAWLTSVWLTNTHCTKTL